MNNQFFILRNHSNIALGFDSLCPNSSLPQSSATIQDYILRLSVYSFNMKGLKLANGLEGFFTKLIMNFWIEDKFHTFQDRLYIISTIYKYQKQNIYLYVPLSVIWIFLGIYCKTN